MNYSHDGWTNIRGQAISLDTYARHLEVFGEVQEIVFGYDELFEKLRPYEDQI